MCKGPLPLWLRPDRKLITITITHQFVVEMEDSVECRAIINKEPRYIAPPVVQLGLSDASLQVGLCCTGRQCFFLLAAA